MNSYTDCLDIYTDRRKRGILKRGIKLANNTYLEWCTRLAEDLDPDFFAVRLHSTRIVTFHADGRIVLNDGGWKTVTTKARQNEYLPAGWGVYSDQGVWYLQESCPIGTLDYDGRDGQHSYADGITIHPDGSATGIGPDPKAQLKLRKRIRAYAKAYIEAFYAGEVPAPSAGDCFGCSMLASDGTAPMGGADHMLSHLDESYFVPSILARAAKRFGVSQAAQHTIGVVWSPMADGKPLAMDTHWARGVVSEQLEKAVRRHCYAECGLGV